MSFLKFLHGCHYILIFIQLDKRFNQIAFLKRSSNFSLSKKTCLCCEHGIIQTRCLPFNFLPTASTRVYCVHVSNLYLYRSAGPHVHSKHSYGLASPASSAAVSSLVCARTVLPHPVNRILKPNNSVLKTQARFLGRETKQDYNTCFEVRILRKRKQNFSLATLQLWYILSSFLAGLGRN